MTTIDRRATSPLPICSPPDARVPPEFVVPFRRFLPTGGLKLAPPAGGFSLACAPMGPAGIDVQAGLDLRFDQTWTLNSLAVGDLSSTIALAPLEQLTLEMQSTQRRVLDQTTVDSAETQDQLESTTIDKEVMSVARSASHTHSWHVDASGSFSYGPASATVSAGVQDSLTTTSQTSMQHTTEATRKSAHNLKTLHKIEVRGITEGVVTNRLTRVVRNPYRDRTLAVNVFQLVKHFHTEIKVAEVRPALAITVKNVDFTEDFVVANAGFLRAYLLDVTLSDALPDLLQAATPIDSSASQAARATAGLALRFLFDEPNIFGVPLVPAQHDSPPPFPQDPNDPANSFSVVAVDSRTTRDDNQSGLGDALRNLMAPLFTTLNFFYAVYRSMTPEQQADAAVSMALAISTSVGAPWQAALGSDNLKDQVQNLLDLNDFTEPFRRLSGFLATVEGMLRPLTGPADAEAQLAADHARGRIQLNQLINHLNCNKNYYIQRYLDYLTGNTSNQAIVDLVNAVLDAAAAVSGNAGELRGQLDVERAFIDRQEIIVPAAEAASGTTIVPLDGGPPFEWPPPPPVTQDLEVPSDGVHMEVAAGACVLGHLPPVDTVVDLEVKDASLHLQRT